SPFSCVFTLFFFFPLTPPPETYTLSLHDALPISDIRDERPRIGEAGERAEFAEQGGGRLRADARDGLQQLGIKRPNAGRAGKQRSEEHTSELQSRFDLVCRLLLEKKKKKKQTQTQ